MMGDIILEVENLCTSFTTDAGSVQSVRGIIFHVGKGEGLRIVGEPGYGKSVTTLSITGLLEDSASRQANALLFDGEDSLKKSPREMRKIRGNRIDMIFQDLMTSLNPLFTVGKQIRGPLMRRQKLSRKEAKKKALVMLEAVGLPSPEHRLKQYPYEPLGDMRQRVMIAIVMCCRSKLLIADEPITALDVTIQTQTLELMAHMKNEFNTSAILVIRNLGVISSPYIRVIVMYGGLIMKEGKTEDTFYQTGHPYTAELLTSIPKRAKKKLMPIFGTPSNLLNPLKECPFVVRCSRAMKPCAVRQPSFCDLGNRYVSACWPCNEPVKARVGEVKL